MSDHSTGTKAFPRSRAFGLGTPSAPNRHCVFTPQRPNDLLRDFVDLRSRLASAFTNLTTALDTSRELTGTPKKFDDLVARQLLTAEDLAGAIADAERTKSAVDAVLIER